MMEHTTTVLLSLCFYIRNVVRIIRNDVYKSLSTVSGIQTKCLLNIVAAAVVVVIIQAGFVLDCFLLARNES